MANFVLFDLILYIPVNNFSLMWGQVFLGCTSTNQRLMCLAKGHNAVTPMRLKHTNPLPLDSHSTTEHIAASMRFCTYHNGKQLSSDRLVHLCSLARVFAASTQQIMEDDEASNLNLDLWSQCVAVHACLEYSKTCLKWSLNKTKKCFSRPIIN